MFRLTVVLLKPSKYDVDGFVQRFKKGFMPNSTLPFMRSLLPLTIGETELEVHAIDEYVQTDLDYLSLLEGTNTLVALIGVQSHQMHRALDLAALARKNGAMAIIGGPHPMTCDTTMLQNRGVSFALAEAELILPAILDDAVRGELRPFYGADQRWQDELEAGVTVPPSQDDLKRYVMPMLGLYPARGCPFDCNFCAITKISGRRIRTHPIDLTMQSLRNAKAAGVKRIMFTSDNFNKIPDVDKLLHAMIREQINLPFFIQCDTQIGSRDSHLLPLLAQAGCFQIFLGVESFNREVLKSARKFQNHPERYAEIVRLCRENGIISHFSNIIGFPQDTEEEIEHHLNQVMSLGPTGISCYILTPIPGTDQYADFLKAGIINEKNLDRFDGTHTTWLHEKLNPAELRNLLFRFYARYYSLRHTFETALIEKRFLSTFRSMIFMRWNSFKKLHPMSGGIGQVKLDHVREFIELRLKHYGFELIPLPNNLELSAHDAALNRMVNPAVLK